jgi:nicotinamide-nucleotide amidase
MTIHIITIGDELLIGQVIDTNSARMAQLLLEIGARVTGKTCVGDDHNEIVKALASAKLNADVTLVTGGLGPTKDDITKKALADFYRSDFVFHQPTFERITQIWQRLGRPLTDDVRNQCLMPQNAEVLPNKVGSAPGMWFDEDGRVLVSMPGVPFEMEYLMEHEVLPRLQKRFDALPTVHKTLLTAGEGESVIATYLKDFEEHLPPAVKLAYLPAIARVRLRLTVSHPDAATAQDLLTKKFGEMERCLPAKLIAGYDSDTLESAIGKRLKEKKLTLATAESCTGGYLAHLITAVPGSSAYFSGSVVAYANAVKSSQLGVSPDTLQAYGAVSEQTVREMVAGAIKHLNTDLAIATSGIAGPGGGSLEKPVGTIWVAVGSRNRVETKKLQLGKDRLRNIQSTAYQALNFLRLFLLEEDL